MPRGKKKGPFADFPMEYKRRIAHIWKKMSEADKEHFINQVTYALASWGTDDVGRELVAVVIEKLIEDGSMNLADFGLYLDWLLSEGVDKIYPQKKEGIVKAAELVESYRLRNELPAAPSKMLA